MIKYIAYTAYPSNDVAGARLWYEETLGLQFAGPYVEDGVEKYNEAHVNGGCFSLMWSPWVGREPGSAAGVVFEVANLEDAITSLHAKGIVTDGLFDGPACKQVSLSDPEGNKITLHEKKPLV